MPYIFGCTDPTQFNYDPAANTDNGSCVPVVNGCTDPLAFNYDEDANTDNGSCIDVVTGCMDSDAYNFSIAANMANRVVDVIDIIVKDIKKERAEQSISILNRRESELTIRLFEINDSLVEFANFGILDVPLQIERLTEYYAKSLLNGNQSGIKLIKSEMNNLSKYGSSQIRLLYDQELVQEKLDLIKLEKENIKLEMDADFTNRFIIDRAEPSDKKSYPVRWLIVLLSLISSLFMSLVILFINEKSTFSYFD